MRSFLMAAVTLVMFWTSSACANDFTDCGEAFKLKAGNEVTDEIKTRAGPIIAACTRIIQLKNPPKNLDLQGVYVFRGFVWYALHDYDKAIADYTTSINMPGKANTSNASIAYSFRSIAFGDKNEFDLAIADRSERDIAAAQHLLEYMHWRVVTPKARCPTMLRREKPCGSTNQNLD